MRLRAVAQHGPIRRLLEVGLVPLLQLLRVLRVAGRAAVRRPEDPRVSKTISLQFINEREHAHEDAPRVLVGRAARVDHGLAGPPSKSAAPDRDDHVLAHRRRALCFVAAEVLDVLARGALYSNAAAEEEE